MQIDFDHKHRHLPGSLSALPLIAAIYETLDPAHDVFILSKGHACAALYAVLEHYGYHPNVASPHPDRDPANGVTMTAGSLGHGLPTAVGLAWAKKNFRQPGVVHVLLGDGECQEGTTYEALNLAARFCLRDFLRVHVDWNAYQGSEALVSHGFFHLDKIFPVTFHATKKGQGIAMFEQHPEQSTHLVTEPEYRQILQEVAEAAEPQTN